MGSLMEPVQYLKLKVACQEKSFRNRLVELKLPVAEVKFSQTFLQLCSWLLMILPAHTDPCFCSSLFHIQILEVELSMKDTAPQ